MLIILLITSTATWSIAAAVSYVDSRREIEDLFDAELAQIARILLTLSNHELYEEILLHGGSDATVPLRIDELPIHRYEKILVYQVWINNDILALRSAHTAETPLSRQTQGYANTNLNNTQWRVFSISDSNSGLTVHVGVPNNNLHRLAGEIAIRVLNFFVIALITVGLLTWLGVGKALQPLYRIASQVSQRNLWDLAPINSQQVPEETKPLIDALNSLFRRLDAAFYHERCFTSDAAHELRTPLAGIAAHNEVALLADSQQLRASSLRQIKDGVHHMTHLIQQLLILARFDFPNDSRKVLPVNIQKLSSHLIKDLEKAALSKSIDLSLDYRGTSVMPGIESAMVVMLRNLLENAIRYTPRNGIVRLNIICLGDEITLRIADSGPGIPEEDKVRVFQRFYRGNNKSKYGSGLGLSIVQRCVEMHSGEITVSTSDYGGLQLDVNIPTYKKLV